jgi:hypothetical protein
MTESSQNVDILHSGLPHAGADKIAKEAFGEEESQG